MRLSFFIVVFIFVKTIIIFDFLVEVVFFFWWGCLQFLVHPSFYFGWGCLYFVRVLLIFCMRSSYFFWRGHLHFLVRPSRVWLRLQNGYWGPKNNENRPKYDKNWPKRQIFDKVLDFSIWYNIGWLNMRVFEGLFCQKQAGVELYWQQNKLWGWAGK